MHVSSRLLRASSGAALAQATEVVLSAVTHIRDTHGVEMGAGVQVGGDGLLLGVTSTFDRLADLEAARAAIMGDTTYQQIVAGSEGLFAPTIEDTIWKSRLDPGAPDVFANVSTADAQLTSVAEAMRFGLEVATTVSEIGGRQTGFATAVTGRRSRVLWIAYSTSLAELEETNELLEDSPDYVDLFKRSEGLMVPNSLEQQIWQRIAA